MCRDRVCLSTNVASTPVIGKNTGPIYLGADAFVDTLFADTEIEQV